MEIPRHTATDPIEALAASLDEAGCLVVTDACDSEVRDAFVAELAPHMEAARIETDDDPDSFYPGNTRRVIALVSRSKAVEHLLLHPMSTTLCDRHLGSGAEFGYQLHVSATLSVGPGARDQVLHREEDPFTFFPVPRPNLILASMWAITDFCANNGGTRLVPGSHRWPADRKAAEDEVLNAEMPAGSVLFWSGGTLHGGGENRSDDWRYGVILTYSLGWLRQEENQYLSVPPEVAEQLSPELRRMIGYDMYHALGIHDPRVRQEVRAAGAVTGQ